MGYNRRMTIVTMLAFALALASPAAAPTPGPSFLDLETGAQTVAADARAGKWDAAQQQFGALQRNWTVLEPRVHNVAGAPPHIHGMQAGLARLKAAVAQKSVTNTAQAAQTVSTAAHDLMLDVGKQ